MNDLADKLKSFAVDFEGDIFTDDTSRLIYAVDASAYRELPSAVIRPRTKEDIRKLILFAREHKTSIIPRAAGTSLAGQVVGNGIVADISKYFTQILELNEKEHWVRVQPGVVLDELNKTLEPYSLFFGPETSTSNRCMIGGMVGNNACGAHSLIYGSTRDHLLSVKAFLSDGSEVEFQALSPVEFTEKCSGTTLESEIYRNIRDQLSPADVQQRILEEYPEKNNKRRNTGYAIDIITDTNIFKNEGPDLNLSKLIAGSEGTLAFVTEIKLNLVPVPPPAKALVCAHFNSLEDALQGNLIALKYNPGAVELMDKFILDCTKGNIDQQKNRFFIKGDPAAILIIEFARETLEEIKSIAEHLENDFRKKQLGYHFPFVTGLNINKVWSLRKAGLGVLSNIPGDAKPVSVIEDTSVSPEKLPEYIAEFKTILDRYKLECVFHAHVGTGELHLRPVLNLKDSKDVELFRTLAREIALLVKKYRGSLSGEHGDGRLRGEFIPLMVGEANYQILKSIKQTWDPNNIFNPGKIIDTPAMDTSLRYTPGKQPREIKTIFDFSADGGIIRATERCNGSGDCRKSAIIGGTMCPSFMATRDENTTTRARANILREFLTNSQKSNPFDHKEIYDIMDLCLSCKGCKSECPSNVDITKYKAEFLQHYYDANGIPLRTRAIANITSLNKLAIRIPSAYNYLINNKLTSNILKRTLGFATERTFPKLSHQTLTSWNKKRSETEKIFKGKVYLLADEFTEYNDTEVGKSVIRLLEILGYRVTLVSGMESGRTYLSKGLVRHAAKIANKNVLKLKDLINSETPLLGIEPSVILTFRDEYLELVDKNRKEDAKKLATGCLMIDEFIAREFKAGNISRESFTTDHLMIKLHGHCYQKALASTSDTKTMLSIPLNYKVEEIKSGCCGMAGSFGYEKEHYELSMKIGELVLFPAVRTADAAVIIAAPGTSCRHQIKDGTGRTALHPAEILYRALKSQ